MGAESTIHKIEFEDWAIKSEWIVIDPFLKANSIDARIGKHKPNKNPKEKNFIVAVIRILLLFILEAFLIS
jgi:hypothetical protein